MGTLSNFRLLKSQLPSKYKIAFHSNKIKLFEIPTLNLIKKMADRDNFYAWYIHTKGVTSVEKVGPRIKESRKFLEHFIIDRHADCIKSLTNYDCCGIGWQCSEISRLASCKNYCYFCGNFWWTKSEFIKKLHYITSNNRLAAEVWLTEGEPRVRNIYKCKLIRYDLLPKGYTKHKIFDYVKLL